MKCDRFEERLQEALDDRRSPGRDRELVQHAAECPQCRALLSSAERLSGLWGAVLADAAPAGSGNSAATTPTGRMASTERRERWWTKGGAASWSWTAAAPPAAVAALLIVMLTLAQRPAVREPKTLEEGVAWSSSREGGRMADEGHGRRERRGARGGDWLFVGGRPSSNAGAAQGDAAAAAESRVDREPVGAPRRVSLAMSGGALLPVEPSGERASSGEAIDGGDAEPLAGIVTVLGESWTSLRQVKMDEMSEVAEGLRPLTQSVGTVMEALRGTWRGARRERMQERAPDTSRVAENNWIA